MGIVQKQTIIGTIITYAGFFLGFLTTGLIMPNIIGTQEIGLTKLIVVYSSMFALVGNLGFTNAILKYFPQFRNKEKRHNGFLYILMMINLFGFLIGLLLYFIFKGMIVTNNVDKSTILADYVYLIIPVFLATQLFNALDYYLRVLYDSVTSIFHKEVMQRIYILTGLVLFYFEIITIHQFILLYATALTLPTLSLVFVLIRRNEFSLRPQFDTFVNWKFIREMLYFSFFTMCNGYATLIILNIDSIMISKMIGVDAMGIYSVMYIYGTLIIIPSRVLKKVLGPVVADAWKENDLKTIEDVYEKSIISQLLVGAFIFIGIWSNVDNILRLLPAEYAIGRNVIIFIGLSNVFDLASGVNSLIISTSNFFKANFVILMITVVVCVILNYILIKAYGLDGAAISSALSVLFFTSMKFIYLKYKINSNPLSFKVVLIIIISAIALILQFLIPILDNVFVDACIRSSLVTSVFLILSYYLKISVDFNNIANKFLIRLHLERLIK